MKIKSLSALVLSAAAVLPACTTPLPVTRTVFGIGIDGQGDRPIATTYNDNRSYTLVDAPRARVINMPAPVQNVSPAPQQTPPAPATQPSNYIVRPWGN
ncbi:MAG: hypothetical protein Q7R56_02640 [Nanoarchaeota archaeon]|nr:hypothetical protein [Nanoarchaeota archaeon]